MRTIERASSFKKDYKRELKGRHRTSIESVLRDILIALATDKELEPKYRDHDLIGNWAGFRECHIKPDLLLIYRKISDDILQLARLGSHNKLFG